MSKTFWGLLGNDAHLLRRYLWLATIYGLLFGLTIAALAPLMMEAMRGDLRSALCWLAALLLGVVLSWLGRRHVEQAGVRVGVAVLQSGRHQLGKQMASLPVGWFTQHNTARVAHVITQGMMAIAQLPAHVFTPLISGVATASVVLIGLFVLNPVLGLIGLLALPLLAGAYALGSVLAGKANAAFEQDYAQASQRIVEFAQAQSVLRAFSAEGSSLRFVELAMAQQRQSGLRLMVQSALSSLLSVWAVQLVFAALLGATALWLNRVLGSTLAVNDLLAAIAALLLVVRFIEPLLEVASYAEVVRSAGDQLRTVREVLDAKPLPQASKPQAPQDASVELRDVAFAYPGSEQAVLLGVSLRVEPGTMTALIGASGSGKTTVMRLLARFFDASAGQILVGGVDVREMEEAQLAAQLSQIFQDSYLLNGSIEDNIRVGKASASDAEVLQAAQQVGLGELVASLPQGMDTQIGERGVRLSGGERQRIAIARALIKDAAILLVDEATAALDTENQAAITQTLSRLRGKRTLVVIAHQLSTVAMADQIVVLDAGRVVECGSPAQLLAQQGRYAQFLAQREAARGWRMEAAAADGGGL